jgi:hypothetical protein
MIKSVVREHHFSPFEINDFYLDGIDFYGLEFYYEDIKELNSELKMKNKK